MILTPEIQTISSAGKYSHTAQSDPLCFPRHHHRRLELLVIKKGIYRIATPDGEATFYAGDVCMINRYAEHEGFHCLTGDEEGQYYYVHISLLRIPRKLSLELDQLVEDLESGSIKLVHRVAAEQATAIGLNEQLLALADAFLQSKGYSELSLLVKTLQVLLTIAEHRLYTVPQLQAWSPTPFVQEVAAYLDIHYAEDLHLEDVAQKWGYTPRYFCSLFKKHFDTTFTHYLRHVRINKFLTHPKLSLQTIADCAADVGFSNYSYFYHCFRRKHLCSPREYLTRTWES